MLGNIGFPEIMIILVIVLLLFGAKRIPEIAGSMGKGIKEFKKSVNEATRDIDVDSPRYEPRLTSPDLEQPRRQTQAEEASRPEPKRLG
ncbi:MAG TPA: twin-arginine translocase TatA/TatE family subunit [Gemmatimonadaceae bacterium]|nr:twin-arginine translocase TatA/TatE family subunit [Gemmatimonadaceae bacterium]